MSLLLHSLIDDRPTAWFFFFFFNDTATTEIYTLSLHDALPISGPDGRCLGMLDITGVDVPERPELMHLALRCARAIEDRLLRALPHALLLHLNWPGGPLGQEGEGLLAVDAEGHVAGRNTPARPLLPQPPAPPG